MKKVVFLTLATAIFFGTIAKAQSVLVLDSLKATPIAYATVIVLNAAKDSIIQQGHTDTKGQYDVSARYLNRAFISVTMIGYKKRIISYQPKSMAVKLSPTIIGLHDVTVTAVADPMKFNGNKIEYDISQIAHAEHLNTAQILDRLPLLEIQDNKLKMMNESLTVYIDGKPNPIYSTVDGLRSLPPQAIDKVELSLVPSARANGGKVLNIILKRDFYLGFNGSFDGSANLYFNNERGSSTYWRKTFGIDAIADFTSSSFRQERYSVQDNLLDHSQLLSQALSTGSAYNGGLFLSGFYNVDKSNSFDVQLSIHDGGGNSHTRTTTETMASTSYAELYNNQPSGTPLNFSLNFTRKLTKDGDKLYILTNLSSSLPSRVYTLKNSGWGDIGLGNQTYTSNGNNKEQTLELILEKNSGKLFKYTLGSKVISRDNRNDTQTQTDSAFSTDDFRVKQFVSTSYADGDLIVRKFTLHTALRLDYNSNRFTTVDYAPQHFLNFVPTVTLSYNKSRNDIFLLSLSRTLLRPGLYQYQPISVVTGAYREIDGNVNLRNELHNALTLSYFGNYRFARLAFNLSYTNISGYLNDVLTVDSNNIVHQTPVNVDAYNYFTFGFSVDFGLFKKLRISQTSNVSLIRQRFAGQTTNNWSGYLSDRLYYEVSKKGQLGVTLLTFSPNLIPYGKSQSMDYLKLTANYSYFFDISNQLPASLSISLINPQLPHGTKGYEYVNSPILRSESNSTTRNPVATLSFRITFKGKTLGNRTFNKSKNIENSDLKTP
jgi:hypothetical protein